MYKKSPVELYTQLLRESGIEPYVSIKTEKTDIQKEQDAAIIKQANDNLALDYALFREAAQKAGCSPDEFYKRNLSAIEKAKALPATTFVSLEAYNFMCNTAFKNFADCEKYKIELAKVQNEIVQQKKSNKTKLGLLITVLILVVAIAFGLNYASPNNQQMAAPPQKQTTTSSDNTNKPSTTSNKPASSLTAQSFYNGMVVKAPRGSAVAPLTVSTKGNLKYYVVLVDKTHKGTNNMAFCVVGGKTVEKDVPLGNYDVYYATGAEWYGKDHLFGEKTSYYKCDETFLFYEDGDSYMGWTLELYEQTNGNLDTDPVSEAAFPAV